MIFSETQAFRWLLEHEAVVRFFRDEDTGHKKIRVTVLVGVDKQEPLTEITLVHPSDHTGAVTLRRTVARLADRLSPLERRATMRVVGVSGG